MAYIIENATILKNNHLTKSSIMISDNRIVALQPDFRYNKLIKMDAEDYVMTPAYCVFNTNIPLNNSFQNVKDFMTKYFLAKGCTTLLTVVPLSLENELPGKIKEMKTALLNSPIDYLIGVKIPLNLVTQAFIRKCKKERIPAIFVELTKESRLEDIPWGWIREALFPYNCPLIPVINCAIKQETKSILSKWKVIMIKEKIPAIYEEVPENLPLSTTVLNKIGLYPDKASLMHGSEVSYNLYVKDSEIMNVDEVTLFHYHNDRLLVTVHKGKVVRSGKQVLFKPGNGEYVKVRIPSYFSLS